MMARSILFVGVLALGAPGSLALSCKTGADVECPGSGTKCAGDQCCPGYAGSGGDTFPCPSASSGFSGCVNNTKVDDCLSTSSLRGSLARPPRKGKGGSLSQSLDQTDVTARLNDNLDNYDRGVVFRTPDFIKTDGPKPASLWRSDIFPPNQFYMLGDDKNPITPMGTWALVGYAVDDDMWDDVVLDTYYPHDANACDAVQAGKTKALGRCGWTGENWECPGAWVAGDTVGIQYDTNAVGASNYACRGCHFDNKDQYGTPMDWHVNQDFDVVDLSTGFCNCPSDIDYSRDGVCEWVQQNLIDTGKMFNPSWWGDPTTCWVDNPVAMSHLQNCYYWQYYNSIGSYDSAMYEWWGWNEIGANAIIDDPSSWQAVMIFLPAQLWGQGLGDLSDDRQQYVEDYLLKMEGNGKLQVGSAFITTRPGSYVVMANEWPDDNSNWNHYFFCQSWSWSQLQVCFQAREDDPDGTGYCYLEWTSNSCL